MKSAEGVKRAILRHYDKDPKNWYILSGRDRHGYHDLAVMHGTDLWLIKEQLINPYKSVGFAVKTFGKEDQLESLNSYQYGVRPISRIQIEEMAETIQAGKSVHEVLSEIMRHRPISFRDIRGPAIVQGPILHADRPIDLLSERQRDLDLKLRLELEKLLMKKYRQTIIPYT